jgi:phosphohistidine swiveling domain-containing protein
MEFKFLGKLDRAYIYPWYIAELSSTKDIKKIAGQSIRQSIIIIKNSCIELYYESKSLKNISKYFLDKLINDKRFLNKIETNIFHRGILLENFCKIISNEKIKNKSDKELLSIYAKYIQLLKGLRTWGWIPVFLDGLDKSLFSDYLWSKLVETLKNTEKKEISEYYSLLSSSEKMSLIRKEEIDRSDITAEIIKHAENKLITKYLKQNKHKDLRMKFPSLFLKILKHQKKYAWLTYGYSGPPMSLKYLFSLILESFNNRNDFNGSKEIKDKYLRLQKNKEKLLKKLKLPPNIVYLFRISSELMYLKDFRKGIYQKSYLLMDSLINEIARRKKLKPRQIKYLLFDEVCELLGKNKPAFFNELANSRIEAGCCLMTANGQIKVFPGEQVDWIKRKFMLTDRKIENKLLKHSDILSGMIAFKGIVRGKVRIVNRECDVKFFKKGEILVSRSTNPDLIIAMKNSAAIITDTGGITSHAAIISRELEIPCVVGTKNATSHLKNGYLVEVDANNGLIKLLKRYTK